MARKVFSVFNPPVYKPEVIKGPSLCDKLADEPLEKIVKRYLSLGMQFPQGNEEGDLELSGQTTMKDIDEAFDDFASADVSRMDTVQRSECGFLAQAQLAEEAKRVTKSVHKEPKKADKHKESSTPIEGVENGSEGQN